MASVPFRCPACRKPFEVDELDGQQVGCPHCDQTVQIPHRDWPLPAIPVSPEELRPRKRPRDSVRTVRIQQGYVRQPYHDVEDVMVVLAITIPIWGTGLYLLYRGGAYVVNFLFG